MYSWLSMSSLSNDGLKFFIVETGGRERKMCLKLKSQDNNKWSHLLIECKVRNWNPYNPQTSPFLEYRERHKKKGIKIVLVLGGRKGTFKYSGNGGYNKREFSDVKVKLNKSCL